jgi:hypothetical protein
VKAGRYDNTKLTITTAKNVRPLPFTHRAAAWSCLHLLERCRHSRCNVLVLQLKRGVGRDKDNAVLGHYSGANMKLLGYIEARKVRSRAIELLLLMMEEIE